MGAAPNTILPNSPLFLVGAYDRRASSGQFSATDALEAMIRASGCPLRRYLLPIRTRTRMALIDYPKMVLLGIVTGIRFLLAVKFSKQKPRAIIAPLGQSYVSFLREGLLTLLGSAVSGAPSIYVLHATYFLSWPKNSLKARGFLALLRRSRAVIVLGPRMQAWIDENVGADRPTVIQIDNLGEIPPLTLEAVERKHKVLDTRVRLLFFSSLFQSKGFGDFLKALTVLDNDTLSSLELSFCGAVQSNPFDSERVSILESERRIEQTLGELRMRGLVATWHRAASNQQREQLFHSAHIFALPSYSEAQPLVLINAMLSGCACIVTPVGEISNMLNSDSAIFVKPGDTAAIARAITRLTIDNEIRLRIAGAANRIATARFNEQVIKQKWLDVLASL